MFQLNLESCPDVCFDPFVLCFPCNVFVIHSVLEIIVMSLQWCFLFLVLNTLREIWWQSAS